MADNATGWVWLLASFAFLFVWQSKMTQLDAVSSCLEVWVCQVLKRGDWLIKVSEGQTDAMKVWKDAENETVIWHVDVSLGS